jgi:hypothetical protein
MPAVLLTSKDYLGKPQKLHLSLYVKNRIMKHLNRNRVDYNNNPHLQVII